MAAPRPCSPQDVKAAPPAFVSVLHVPTGLRGNCEGAARGIQLLQLDYMYSLIFSEPEATPDEASDPRMKQATPG